MIDMKLIFDNGKFSVYDTQTQEGHFLVTVLNLPHGQSSVTSTFVPGILAAGPDFEEVI